jgi:ATP-dependent DNA helicase RecG
MDVLVTTATPIPRTMRLSLYNDLSVSTIKTRPSGQLTVSTRIIQNKHRDTFYRELKQKILQGDKAFIVLPLIEDSTFFPDLKSIKGESQYLRGIFSPLKAAIISSRTPIHQRARAIDRFRRGDIQVIISTTVIEIGIDIPDATIMVIENADRYGLAQLHQLRGRVGRSEKSSSCYLIPSINMSASGQERLQTLTATRDGFKIAEKDLEMRGGGIISGLEQSGFFDFKVANLKTSHEQLKLAQKDAARILANNSWQQGFVPPLLESIKDKLKYISFS